MQLLISDATNIEYDINMAAIEKNASDDRLNGNVHCVTSNVSNDIEIKTKRIIESSTIQLEAEITNDTHKSKEDLSFNDEDPKNTVVKSYSHNNSNGTSNGENENADVIDKNGQHEETDDMEANDTQHEDHDKQVIKTDEKMDITSNSLVNETGALSETDILTDKQLFNEKEDDIIECENIASNESKVAEDTNKIETSQTETVLLDKIEHIDRAKDSEIETRLIHAEIVEENKDEPAENAVTNIDKSEASGPETVDESNTLVSEITENITETVNKTEAGSDVIDNPTKTDDKLESLISDTTENPIRIGNKTMTPTIIEVPIETVDKSESLISDQTSSIDLTESPRSRNIGNPNETENKSDSSISVATENLFGIVSKTHDSGKSKNPVETVDKSENSTPDTTKNSVEIANKSETTGTGKTEIPVESVSMLNESNSEVLPTTIEDIEITDISDSPALIEDAEIEHVEIEPATKNTCEAIEEMDCEDITEIVDNEDETIREVVDGKTINDNIKIIEYSESVKNCTTQEIDKEGPVIEEIADRKNADENKTKEVEDKPAPALPKENITCKPISKLSNTLDILSDDEDIMLIEDVVVKDNSSEADISSGIATVVEEKLSPKPIGIGEDELKETKLEDNNDLIAIDKKVDVYPTPDVKAESPKPEIKESKTEQKPEIDKKLLPKDFLKSYKKNLADMTRDDLEEFCVLKIVESVIDKGSLNEIKTKLKSLAQTLEDYKNTAKMLTKQNRDLQVVLKSVQEEQKKKVGSKQVTTPLKITRSVGMQVLLTDKNLKHKVVTHTPQPVQPSTPTNTTPSPRCVKTVKAPANNIPVPKLVPAQSGVMPKSQITPTHTQKSRVTSVLPNGVRTYAIKPAEKRVHNKSDTVDLTDDEPPHKQLAIKTSPAQRMVNPQTIMAQRQPTGPGNSPRKVFIPISGNGAARPQLMMKSVSPGNATIRHRTISSTTTVRPGSNQSRNPRIQPGRHPAPLPETPSKPHQPLWKNLPPPPDLKLSKVENGIVISWKIEGYQEDRHEEIASYQLYAYQETSAPPNTSLWKKIGDVKALPLPMACTLTQFMAGYKYYFAVRAVDIKSRCGPFSLPGSILLLQKS